MNKDIKSYTHVALVLDASGSMSSIKNATVSTMKEFFESLKSPEDKTVIDLWQFDNRVRHLIKGADIEKGGVRAIENYSTSGCTALYDAICVGIDELGKKFEAMNENDRPDAVVFAILTDGFENASQKFNINDVKARIEHQSSIYSWTFRFLAANQDAILTGSEMGLQEGACETFDASEEGVRECAAGMARMCSHDIRFMARKLRARKRSIM